MSFDVFFQRFLDGEADTGGGERMRQVLEPFIVREEPEHQFALVEYGDGSADVYLDDDGMTATHVSGERPWDLLVQGAQAAGWVILPVGCPTCITDDRQRTHLPHGLDDVTLVDSGEALLRVIRSSRPADFPRPWTRDIRQWPAQPAAIACASRGVVPAYIYGWRV
jgi:hypothetical protein